jgi:hypothetical protein
MSLSDCREGLDKLLRMLEEQRDALTALAIPTGSEGAPVLDQPSATYLQLDRAAITNGNFAAASPWFARYCDSVFTESLEPSASGEPRQKWRGPLMRDR